MKTYIGSVTPRAMNWTVRVIDDPDGTLNENNLQEVERATRKLDPRFDLANHSPTGFAWGYGGSGPAQLALAILCDCLGDDGRARRLYQDFKFMKIARLDKDKPFRLTETEVQAAVRDLEMGKRPVAPELD